VIPILLILAAGGLAAYALSPKAHAWADDHAKAIRDALAAHREADAKLDQAQAATDVHAATLALADDDIQVTAVPPAPQPTRPPTPAPHPHPAPRPAPPSVGPADLLQHAWDSLKAAAQANAVAAASTTTALKTAKSDQEKAAAAQSAAAVSAQQQQIAAAAAAAKQLGSGQCDVRSYAGVSPQIRDALLAKLHGKGMTVTGNNPWDIDTGEHGVKLSALWDSREQTLKLVVTAGKGGPFVLGVGLGVVTCDKIWAEIDPILKGIIGA
jgi:hypothetical protein